ncbi:MAG: DUF2058 domain-containing protein [Gammaproteobacteria bacterium]
MGKSLQDQLLEAGAVSKARAEALKKEKQKESRKPAPKGKRRKGRPGGNEQARRDAERARAKKAARDRELAAKQREAAEAKALRAQVRQLVDQHAVAMEDGDSVYNFTDEGVIKRVYLSPAQRAEVVAGRLAIARRGRRYALVPATAAPRIAERDAAAVVVLNAGDDGDRDGDDDYAGYEVPDDLEW